MEYNELIEQLLSEPQKLITKKPFTRGFNRERTPWNERSAYIGEAREAYLPNIQKRIVTQEQFMRELDPASHDVLFDENIPSICVKVADGGYREMRFEKVSLPFQRLIKNKQVMHLTANPMQFTLIDLKPSKKQQEDFITFKQYWELRNQDGMKNKMVDVQLSYGDAGLLYYFDYKGRIKSRILSYADGYVLCPHNDRNGDRILECVYYRKGDVEYIDCYDEQFLHRFTRNEFSIDNTNHGWYRHPSEEHGFNEIPLITKRGDVAWNNVQTAIEGYEMLYNIYLVIFKRFGYGIFYVKGKFKDDGKRIAGSIVLNDTSLEGKGDAKFLSPPAPDGVMETLKSMKENIQLGSSTTFLLPDDVKTGGDVAGIAIQLVQSLDLELAHQKVIEWQNVADKMVRLFKYGLSKELVNEGINKTAVTDFETLRINAKFKVWKPLNEMEYNTMVTMLTGAGVLSKESGIELNTLSKPDEKARLEQQEKEQEEKTMKQMQQTQIVQGKEEGNE